MAENTNWGNLPQLLADLAIIQKLDDEPNDVGGLTAAELKAKFDEAAQTIQSYLNSTLLPAVQEAGEAAEGDAGEAAEELETALNAHTGDNVRHITAAERALWNKGLFWCVYGTTTFAEITAAKNVGKLPVCARYGAYYVYDTTIISLESETWHRFFGSVTQNEEGVFSGRTLLCSDANVWSQSGFSFDPADKQDALTFDSAPTAGSTNPVTSGGVKTALDGKLDVVPIAAGAGTNALVENNAEGNIATGDYSHAEGDLSHAIGRASHAEGFGTTANGAYSHAEGDTTAANGMNSHAEGEYTRATHLDQHVFGAYNEMDPSGTNANSRGTFVEIVGNGTSDNDRSNARTLAWNGDEILAGGLTLGRGPIGAMDAATKQYVDEHAAPDMSHKAEQSALAAEYDSTATYAVGDFCTHNGRLYKCTTAITTAEAWTAAHWTETDIEEYVTIMVNRGKAGATSTAVRASAWDNNLYALGLPDGCNATTAGYLYTTSNLNGATIEISEQAVDNDGPYLLLELTGGTLPTRIIFHVVYFPGTEYSKIVNLLPRPYVTEADLTTALNDKANQSALAAEYDSTATYAIGDYCTYNGLLYICSTAITTAEAWTAAHWTATTLVSALTSAIGNAIGGAY